MKKRRIITQRHKRITRVGVHNVACLEFVRSLVVRESCRTATLPVARVSRTFARPTSATPAATWQRRVESSVAASVAIFLSKRERHRASYEVYRLSARIFSNTEKYSLQSSKLSFILSTKLRNNRNGDGIVLRSQIGNIAFRVFR